MQSHNLRIFAQKNFTPLCDIKNPNMTLIEKHQKTIQSALEALNKRTLFSHFSSNPKDYAPEAMATGRTTYKEQLQKPFDRLDKTENPTFTTPNEWSAFNREKLNITYPALSIDAVINNAKDAGKNWSQTTIDERAAILIEALEKAKEHFYEIAFATQHTTGQSFSMAFQEGGPNTAHMALEAIALGVKSLKDIPSEALWEKPLGRSSLKINKSFVPVPKGIGLVISQATMPSLYSIPAVFANLITGNPTILKPDPTAVYPLAIYVSILQEVLRENNHNPLLIQLALSKESDSLSLAQNANIAIIDYIGETVLGTILKNIRRKTSFIQKSAINTVIIDSAKDLRTVCRNLAFSISLYSGQLFTSPKLIFIPETGIPVSDGETVAYDDAVDLLTNEISALVLHPKMGAETIGAIQSEETYNQTLNAKKVGGKVLLDKLKVENPKFERARICTPIVLEVSPADKSIYQETFTGPVIFVVKTKNTSQSILLAQELAKEQNSLHCSLYSTSETIIKQTTSSMNEVFVPIDLNFTGFASTNQHVPFSDLQGINHFGTETFVNKRFVWIENRNGN